MSNAQFMTRVLKKWIELDTGANFPFHRVEIFYSLLRVEQTIWNGLFPYTVDLSFGLYFVVSIELFFEGLVEFCEHSWHDNIKIESASKAWLHPFRLKSIKVWAKTVFSNFLKIFKDHQKFAEINICSFWGNRRILADFSVTDQ